MARETKAQREVRELKEEMERTTVAKSTYVFRMMAVLARATKQNFEMAVYTLAQQYQVSYLSWM